MAARQHLEREAQRAQHFALLGRLAAGVSHEIRNPLGAVVLHVDLLEEELRQPSADSAAEVAQALAEIKTQLARLEDLVQDYLSLVRVGHLERTPQDLAAALHTWARAWQGLAAARGMTLQVEGVAALGQVAFHGNTLHRALLNLVQNALDAMEPGGTVTLGASPRLPRYRYTSVIRGWASPPHGSRRFSSPCIRRSRVGPGWACILCTRLWRPMRAR